MKYSKDGPFSDPLVRCDGCKTVIRTRDTCSIGGCPECGHKRVVNVQLLSQPEMARAREWKIDPEFLELFQPRELPSEGVN